MDVERNEDQNEVVPDGTTPPRSQHLPNQTYLRSIEPAVRALIRAQNELSKTASQYNDRWGKPLAQLSFNLDRQVSSILRSNAALSVLSMVAEQSRAYQRDVTRLVSAKALVSTPQATPLAGMIDARQLAPTIQSAWLEPLKKYAQISQTLAEQVRVTVPTSTLTGIAETLKRAAELHRESLRLAALPSNLRAIEDLTSDAVMDFTLEHGISLYLVAPTGVARSFLRAQDAKAVRRVLGDRREAILNECSATLSRCDSLDTVGLRTALEQSIEAMGHDLYYPAQAAAAAALDRLSSHIAEQSGTNLASAAKRHRRETVTHFRARLEDLDRWEVYIAAALWTTFEHYFRSKGDRVPTSFSRHAATHALGGRQYSRRSAVQGIMAATSVVAFLNGLS